MLGNAKGQLDVPDLSHPTVSSGVGGSGGTFSGTADAFFACAIADKKVECWGLNNWGKTEAPAEMVDPTDVSAGREHACAVATLYLKDINLPLKRGIQCWGRNKTGESSAPELLNPSQVSSGALHSCALSDEGFTAGVIKPKIDTGSPPYQNLSLILMRIPLAIKMVRMLFR